MVSVQRFIHDEPALFRATCEFVRLFGRVADPVVGSASRESSPDARIAWTLLGTDLFQDISYPEFSTLMETLRERFPGDKLWTLPVPKAQEIEECVESAMGTRGWSLFESVPGIFWSVGLFVRRRKNMVQWLAERSPEELWRDLGEIYFMGKGNPRPKVCAALYRLMAPTPIGLGFDCAPSAKWPPLPLTMGARRYLSILGPAKDGFADLDPKEKQRLATDLYVAVARALVEGVTGSGKATAQDVNGPKSVNATKEPFGTKGPSETNTPEAKGVNGMKEPSAKSAPAAVDVSTAYLAAHSLQFYLEEGGEGFACRHVTDHCQKCPLRDYCGYAE